MPGRPNNTPIIAAIVILAVGGIVGLNIMQQNNDPALQEKIQKEKEQEERAKQKDAPATPAPAADTSQPGFNDVVTWGAEKTLGKSGGTPVVTVGWQWTPAVQANPASIYGAVEAAKQALPNAAIRVVNLDAKPGEVPAGIAVAGAMRMPMGPDGTFPPAGAIVPALQKP